MNDRQIIFISGKLDKGGGERVISILANHFSYSHRVKIVTLLSGDQEYELNKAVEVVHLSKKDTLRFLKLPYWVFKLMKIFKGLKSSKVVIVSFIARVNVITLLANVFFKLPVIISERNDPGKDGRGIFTQIATRILYPGADRIVFQSAYARNLFSHKIQKKGIVISNPIIINHLYETEIVEQAFVNVGRLAPQKNQKLLIQAFSKISNSIPGYKLYIYGEGPLRDSLEKLIDNLGVSDRVFLQGNVDDIHVKVKGCEIFILSSNYEGQSNALLEAMALGMPCIATDLPGQSEIVSNDNVFLIKAGDMTQMSAAMVEMANDPVLRKKLAENAHETMKKFDSLSVIRKWEELVKEAMGHE
ncbi:MAG: glycosyltransferase [Bacteroidales bacterium]|nr:glycosyltransferase [Bacteroidales bacterium]